MPSRDLPGFRDVAALAAASRLVVPPEAGDANGHMNVRHYVALYDDAEWEIFDRIGLGAEHARTARRGLFALEQHLTYAREVDVGDEVSVHMRLLARGPRVLHFVSYLANHTRTEVAGCTEALNGYADLEARRLTPFVPGPELAALDALLDADRRLGWTPQLSGCITVRPERG